MPEAFNRRDFWRQLGGRWLSSINDASSNLLFNKEFAGLKYAHTTAEGTLPKALIIRPRWILPEDAPLELFALPDWPTAGELGRFCRNFEISCVLCMGDIPAQVPKAVKRLVVLSPQTGQAAVPTLLTFDQTELSPDPARATTLLAGQPPGSDIFVGDLGTLHLAENYFWTRLQQFCRGI